MYGTSSKQLGRLRFTSVTTAGLMIVFVISTGTARVSAADVPIVGGTNGPDCNSGGYFTPSSATVTSGDTVTVSVPANDPYAGGVQVHGFPQGNFVVPRGGSVTTAPITANVSYYGTWPSTGCMKGSGTVTISAPVSPPPNNSGGSVTPPSNSSPTSPSPSSPVVTNKTTAPVPTTKSPAAPTAPAPAAQTNPTDTTAGSNNPEQAAKPTATTKLPVVATDQTPKTKNVAVFGGSGVVIIAAAAVIYWRLVARRRPAAPISSVQTVQPQSVDEQGHDHSQ